MLVHVNIVRDVDAANVMRHVFPQKTTPQANAKRIVLRLNSTIMERLVAWQAQ